MKELYFDNASTTRVYPQVVKVMNEVMLYDYGNPSSEHAIGDRASKLIVNAMANISKSIGARAQEIFFTSGSTESNNWALSGVAYANPNKKKIIVSSIEHPSIREVCIHLSKKGYKIVEIPVDKEGFIDIDFIEKQVDSNTLIVSVIHANNLFGTVQNLKKIGDICKKKNVLFHTDASQSFGKLKILVHDWNIDLLSASAHKIGGPKGVGILYVREGVKIKPLIYGGGQQKGLRSGTENVAGILGLEKAIEISNKKDWNFVIKVRDYLISEIQKIGAILIGPKEDRLPNNIFVKFNTHAQRLLYQLSEKGIYVSRGSACESKKDVEDKALISLGLSSKEINNSLRISIPADVTKKDVDYFIGILKVLLGHKV